MGLNGAKDELVIYKYELQKKQDIHQHSWGADCLKK
jgi:hypothetical protein